MRLRAARNWSSKAAAKPHGLGRQRIAVQAVQQTQQIAARGTVAIC
jgi:hypothetical protein